jgi:hypothetical protein
MASLCELLVDLIRESDTPRELVDSWQDVSGFMGSACVEDMRRLGGPC